MPIVIIDLDDSVIKSEFGLIRSDTVLGNMSYIGGVPIEFDQIKPPKHAPGDS